MPPHTVLLFEDETVLRLFPNLRRTWALKGQQGSIDITGRNAQRVLFGSINVRSGHQVLLKKPRMNQEGFQEFLHLLRTTYRRWPVWILLDGATPHKTKKSMALAKQLDIVLIFLPKQCPELNAMDHLWRHVKGEVSANYQYTTIDEHADVAQNYVHSLSNKEAKTKAGILSDNFWLKSFLS